MPTSITHAIPAITVGLGLGKDYLSKRLILTGAFIACIPDLDLISVRFWGIAKDSIYGHRGYTHSIFFALILALIVSLFFYKSGFKKAFIFLTFCAVSHGILDAFTEGGLGVALLWPMSDQRYYAFVQPIMNVGVSFRALYMTNRGLPIFISEFVWVWIPFLILGVMLRFNVFSSLKQKISR